ncbi:MAG: membrane protein insertion efficiency factor YidD [Peptoniphilaceae bacterium]|uniref:membrane protein insertion efficiency factor YidD n=1 Tax=Parvimonas sp. TaxID=1944660 RepID=UPI0025E14E4F|nr:membrane protein insertion efficiency factor YidD [Parvimonas sp.]MCI5997408.1 membrane protein insertion efficiency factor YidD [Parvimonas sp.]MDD7764750.1 membrane protein insertion efficiency factor YidD [Peptoniphilaceae bacterium]MDY3050780.1 membrane protein insertion efficiency factor YidD [Parvimonas sp.]
MRKLAIFLIKGYRKFISPLFGVGKCKYTPTCSEYAILAYEKYNFFKATFLVLWRILRCNPFSKGGHDPLK